MFSVQEAVCQRMAFMWTYAYTHSYAVIFILLKTIHTLEMVNPNLYISLTDMISQVQFLYMRYMAFSFYLCKVSWPLIVASGINMGPFK